MKFLYIVIICLVLFDVSMSIGLLDHLSLQQTPLKRVERSMRDLIAARESGDVSDESGVMSLLQEIKTLLVEDKKTPEEKWREEFGDFREELKTSIRRMQSQLDSLSTSTNQRIDVLIASFTRITENASEDLKRMDSTLTRVMEVEQKISSIEKKMKKKDSSEESFYKLDFESDAEVPPINSHLIIDKLAAYIPESPQITNWDESKVEKREIVKGGHIRSETTADALEKLEKDLHFITFNLTAQNFLIEEVQNQNSVLEQTIRESLKCTCDQTEFESRLTDINSKMSSLERNQMKTISSTDANSANELLQSFETLSSEFSEFKTGMSSFNVEIKNLDDEIQKMRKSWIKTSSKVREIESKTRSSAPAEVKAGLCVYPYTKAVESCFYVSKNKRLNWEEAREHCRSIQGDLAAPKDMELFTKFLSNEKLSRSYTYWLGGSDLEREDSWEWVDGRPIAIDDEMWATSQPNEGKSSNCLGIKLSSRVIGASDSDCSTSTYFVCEQQQGR